jgi:hypothetical protein
VRYLSLWPLCADVKNIGCMPAIICFMLNGITSNEDAEVKCVLCHQWSFLRPQ